jgi:hypothetical protein
MRRSSVILIDQIDAVTYTVGEEVTFLRWGNMKIQSIDKDPASNKITSIRVSERLLRSCFALFSSFCCLFPVFSFLLSF